MRPIAEKGTAASAGTQAIARAAALLREIAQYPSGARASALADRLGLERPTVHRILQRLVEEGLLSQDPIRRTYRLGPLVHELGLLADPPAALHSACAPSVHAIAQESGDTAFAFVLSAYDTVCLERAEGDYPVKALLLAVGGRRPIGTGASSIAMLAAMQDGECRRLLAFNARRLASINESGTDRLLERVALARTDGYVAKHPPDMPEILSLAVAVCDAYQRPVLALSVSALTQRIDRRREALVALLRAEGQKTASRLRASAGAG